MSASQIEASNSGNVASPTLAMDLRASANGCTAAMSTVGRMRRRNLRLEDFQPSHESLGDCISWQNLELGGRGPCSVMFGLFSPAFP